MTIAIVKDGQFLHTTNEPSVRIGDFYIPAALPLDERKQYGMYDFIPARNEASENQKPQGTTFAVDDATATVTESFLYVDMTEQEIKAANNNPIYAEISSLELQQILPRITREYMRATYLAAAQAQGITEVQLRQKPTDEVPNPLYSIAYDKLATFDDQLAVLRSKLK